MNDISHKKTAAKSLRFAVLSLSSTRTEAADESGRILKELLQSAGHILVDYRMAPDDKKAVTGAVTDILRLHDPNALLTTGGTGISPKDVTLEAVRPLFEKEMTAFGVLFAQLSYQEIGSAAFLSRAAAGIIGNAAVFCLPGSPKACRLAVEKLILPELGHIANHLRE